MKHAELSGGIAMKAKLYKIGKESPKEVARAMAAEVRIEMAESMKRTPVDTGAARASHEMVGPIFERGGVTYRIEVGGPALGYVLFLHENLEVYHENGQAKFLESTLRESAPFLAARIAKRYSLRRVVG